MKYFSTFSARMTVIRKDGYYMSKTTASRIAAKLAIVMQFSPIQVERVITMLTRGMTDDFGDDRQSGFTPAELTVVRNLSAWYSFEYHCFEYDESRDRILRDTGHKGAPCFIAIDLNRGYSLVITDR